MIAVLEDGSTRTMKPRSPTCGLGFKSITLTHDDLVEFVDNKRYLMDWLFHTVLPRMVNPDDKEEKRHDQMRQDQIKIYEEGVKLYQEHVALHAEAVSWLKENR